MFTARIILTIIGLVFGGPIGAIIGFLIGSYLDNTVGKAAAGKTRTHGFNWRQAFQQSFQHSFQQSFSQSFVKGIFTLMGHLAKIDGQITQNEITIASNVMTQLRLSSELRHQAMRWFYDGKNQQFDFNDIIQQLRPYSIPPFSRITLTCLTQIALANGAPINAQQRALHDICEQLGIAIPQFNQQGYANSQYHYHDQHHYGYQAKHSLTDDYNLMGLKPEADVATIRKTYRRLMNKCHPDKLAARGATAKEIKAASEKTIKIRSAYENLMRAKGVTV